MNVDMHDLTDSDLELLAIVANWYLGRLTEHDCKWYINEYFKKPKDKRDPKTKKGDK